MMDPERNKFGSGPKELCGSVDLINQFNLSPHHDFFCKSSLPMCISKSHYLQNVVGVREIKKGEGMELDQLFQNIKSSRKRNASIRALDIGLPREAFQVTETSPVILPIAEKGCPKSTKDTKKNKMLKYENIENNSANVECCNKDGSGAKLVKRSGLAADSGNLKMQPIKRRRHNG